MILQVDRVSSIEEALLFRDAGANLIGVELDFDHQYGDDRLVSAELAKSIRGAIGPARLVGIVPPLFDDGCIGRKRDRIERVLALEPDFIQFFRGCVPEELHPFVNAAGVSVIVTGGEMSDIGHIWTSPDDPIGFFYGYATMGSALNPVLRRSEIAYGNAPWEFLTMTAAEPVDGELLRIEDVAAATRAVPLLLDIADVRPHEIVPFVTAFPDAKGFYATLCRENLSQFMSVGPEPLLATLKALQQGSPVGPINAPRR